MAASAGMIWGLNLVGLDLSTFCLALVGGGALGLIFFVKSDILCGVVVRGAAGQVCLVLYWNIV